MSLFVVTVQGVAVLFVRFLQKFFAAFPQYQNTNFYIFGESYAGDAFTSAHPFGEQPLVGDRLLAKTSWTER